jgi:hypothetical protein
MLMKGSIVIPTRMMKTLNSVVASGLDTHGKSGYGNNTNVPTLRHCSWKGTEFDVEGVEGVFVVN